jgi:chromate reductase
MWRASSPPLIRTSKEKRSMSKTLKILGIAGSLRKGSYNASALRAAAELAPEGVEIEVFDIGRLPLFNQDDEQNPSEVVVEFKQKIREADAIIFSTP